MGATTTFSYNDFVAAFPEFGGLNQKQLTGYFTRASFIFANDGTGPVNDPNQQEMLMNLLTAHIAWLNAWRDANGLPSSTPGEIAPAVVGRISSANQGSVSFQADAGEANESSPSQAWYMQTRYGAEFWAATAQFRTAVYIPNPVRVAGTGRSGWRGRGGW